MLFNFAISVAPSPSTTSPASTSRPCIVVRPGGKTCQYYVDDDDDEDDAGRNASALGVNDLDQAIPWSSSGATPGANDARPKGHQHVSQLARHFSVSVAKGVTRTTAKAAK